MTMYRLEVTYVIDIVGTAEEVEELHTSLDDTVYEALPTHCGEPECCPGERPSPYSPASYSTATVTELREGEE